MKAWWNSQLRNSILHVYKKSMERSRIPSPLVWLVSLRPTVNSRSYIFSSSWETSYYFEYYDLCVLLIHDLYTLGFIYCDRQGIKVYLISSQRTSCLQSSAISKLGYNSRTTNNYDAVVFLADIFSGASVLQPQADGVYNIHALSKRLSKTRTWVISFFASLYVSLWTRSYK